MVRERSRGCPLGAAAEGRDVLLGRDWKSGLRPPGLLLPHPPSFFPSCLSASLRRERGTARAHLLSGRRPPCRAGLIPLGSCLQVGRPRAPPGQSAHHCRDKQSAKRTPGGAVGFRGIPAGALVGGHFVLAVPLGGSLKCGVSPLTPPVP